MYQRFMGNNLLTDPAMLAVSSAAAGVLGAAVAEVLGGGTCNAGGEYSGELAIEQFMVEVDTAGDVGTATYRWKGGGAATWEASKVATSASLATLRDGVGVRFGGSGLLAGDRWLIEARRPHGKGALLRKEPEDQWWATGCTLETITADLGQAELVTAVILDGHNLSEAATATLKADDGPDWEAPAFSQVLTVTWPHLVVFLSQTYRYWRLELADPGNAEGVIKASHFYLGQYLELSRRMMQGATETRGTARSEQEVDGVLVGGAAGPLADSWQMQFSRLTASDQAALEALFDGLHDGQMAPLWFLPDSGAPSGLLYGWLGGSLSMQHSNPGRRAVSLTFREYAR